MVRDPAKFKALLCGRRAGKTGTTIPDFADGMLREPGSLNLFVALTISSAREIMWEPFKRLNERHGWGFIFDESKTVIKHPNGSRLLVRGADDVRELEKLRGMPFRRIRIDECGAHRPSYLQYLVEEVLEATLMDHDGDVWLLGTCTKQAFGYFYEITTGRLPGYSVHRWTAAQNPYVNYQRFVHDPEAGLLVRRGWTVDHPIFRREYLAEWVVESQQLVYRFERARNVVARLPELQRGDEWVHVMGLDFGVGDATACVVLAHPRHYGRDVYAVHCWRQSGLAPSEAAERIRRTVDAYRPEVIVGDVGGLGKAYQAEWNRRFPGVEMRAANKQDKRGTLEIVSDALYTANQATRRGFMSLACNEDLHREWASLLWSDDRGDIAQGQDDDTADAAMYAFKACPAFSNAFEPPPPPASARGTTHEDVPRRDPTRDRFAAWNGRR